jgi:hypothetical protein
VSTTVNQTHHKAIKTLGVLAAITSVAYVVAASLALADGPGGIVMPALVNMLASVTVCASSILAGGGWLIERIVAAAVPTLAERVVHQLDQNIEGRVRHVVEMTSARNAAQLTEIVTGEIMADVINSAVNRAHRAGMVLQAQSVIPKGVAPVVHMRTMTTGDN